MSQVYIRSFLRLGMIAFIVVASLRSETLQGNIGYLPKAGSGWLDLPTPLNFQTGDRLRLTIAGTAAQIVVRLLPKGGDPDSAVGIVGSIMTVPPNKVVEVVIRSPRRSVSQISVHGGPGSLWRGLYVFKPDNGPAGLMDVELIRASANLDK